MNPCKFTFYSNLHFSDSSQKSLNPLLDPLLLCETRSVKNILLQTDDRMRRYFDNFLKKIYPLYLDTSYFKFIRPLLSLDP